MVPCRSAISLREVDCLADGGNGPLEALCNQVILVLVVVVETALGQVELFSNPVDRRPRVALLVDQLGRRPQELRREIAFGNTGEPLRLGTR